MRRSLFRVPIRISSAKRTELEMPDRKDMHLPFFCTDPKLMERPKTGEDAPTEPASIAAFSGVAWRMYLRLSVNPKINKRKARQMRSQKSAYITRGSPKRKWDGRTDLRERNSAKARYGAGRRGPRRGSLRHIARRSKARSRGDLARTLAGTAR